MNKKLLVALFISALTFAACGSGKGVNSVSKDPIDPIDPIDPPSSIVDGQPRGSSQALKKKDPSLLSQGRLGQNAEQLQNSGGDRFPTPILN